MAFGHSISRNVLVVVSFSKILPDSSRLSFFVFPVRGPKLSYWFFNAFLSILETLESLERGELVKDYSNGNNGAESEDDDDPRTPTSVSSQGSQGYDSAGSDFVDVEGFTAIPDSSLPELSLQVTIAICQQVVFLVSNESCFAAASDGVSRENISKNRCLFLPLFESIPLQLKY